MTRPGPGPAWYDGTWHRVPERCANCNGPLAGDVLISVWVNMNRYRLCSWTCAPKESALRPWTAPDAQTRFTCPA